MFQVVRSENLGRLKERCLMYYDHQTVDFSKTFYITKYMSNKMIYIINFVIKCMILEIFSEVDYHFA